MIYHSSLSVETTNKIISAYFGTQEGIGYNIIRVPVGGTDFSLREYTYADSVPNDFELNR